MEFPLRPLGTLPCVKKKHSWVSAEVAAAWVHSAAPFTTFTTWEYFSWLHIISQYDIASHILT